MSRLFGAQLRTRTFQSFARASAAAAKLQRLRHQLVLRATSAKATMRQARHHDLAVFAQARLALPPRRRTPTSPFLQL
jgi:hypothetical protein